MAAGGALEPFWNLYQVCVCVYVYVHASIDYSIQSPYRIHLPTSTNDKTTPNIKRQVHKREPSVHEILAELRIGTLKHTPEVRWMYEIYIQIYK